MEEDMRSSVFLGYPALTEVNEIDIDPLLLPDNDREPLEIHGYYGELNLEGGTDPGIGEPNALKLVIEESSALHEEIWYELETHLQNSCVDGVFAEETMPVVANSPSGYESSATGGIEEVIRHPISQPTGNSITMEASDQHALTGYKTWTMHSHTIPDEAESTTGRQPGDSPFTRIAQQKYGGRPASYPDRGRSLDTEEEQNRRKRIHRPSLPLTKAQYNERLVPPCTQLEPVEALLLEVSECVSSTSPEEDPPRDTLHELVGYNSYGFDSPRIRPGGVASSHYGFFGPASFHPEPNRYGSTDLITRQWLEQGGPTGPLDYTQFQAMVNPSIRLDSLVASEIRRPSGSNWAEQLLNLCAAAIVSKNIGRTQHLMWVLNDLASVTGDANQRLAAYGLKALYCRITGGKEAAATYVRPLHHQEETLGPKVVHRALVRFHERNPWHQMSYTMTSQTLLEVFAGKSHVHIIDIGVIKGLQWPIFIDSLVSRPGGPPALLRITTIMDKRMEKTLVRNQRADSDSSEFMRRLVNFAEVLGLPLELNTLAGPVETVTREDLNLRDGEVLAVCCQFRLHRLSDEVPARAASRRSPSRPVLSPRDAFLDFTFKLEPKCLVVGENDSDQNSPDFFTRFQHVIKFWWAFFDSTNTAFNGLDAEQRQIAEYEGGMILLNNIACEGETRIERNEPLKVWSGRILRAGFVPMDISAETKKALQLLMQSSCDGWDLKYTDTNIATLLWKQYPTTCGSIWKLPSSCSKALCKCNLLHN